MFDYHYKGFQVSKIEELDLKNIKVTMSTRGNTKCSVSSISDTVATAIEGVEGLIDEMYIFNDNYLKLL